MKICILIPVLNEAKSIGQIVQSVKSRGLDIVVVDDGSHDGCGEIARKNGAIVLRNELRQGKGASLQKGFDYIATHAYDGVITMDGDGQHDMNDIGKFVALARPSPSCVITGDRMTNAKGMPFVRYWTNRFMSFLISLACGQAIADTQCGYRYISCDILRRIHFHSRAYEIETEILMKASKAGFKIYSVPVKTIYAGEASHINPFGDTLRFIVYFIKEIFTKL